MPQNNKKKTAAVNKKKTIPTPKIRMIDDTIGIYERPVHVPPQSTRLPANVNEYAAPSYPNGRDESYQENRVRGLSSRGLTPPKITIGTGIRLPLVYEILGLSTESKQFVKDTEEVANFWRV